MTSIEEAHEPTTPIGTARKRVGARGGRTDDPTADLIISSNLRPASISAVSCLAEDTISATSLLANLTDGPGTVAMFANPFSGVEEILYVDERGSGVLNWVRKGNDDLSTPGWTSGYVAVNVQSVSVAVHPDGTVYLFATTAIEGKPAPLLVLKLEQQPSGVVDWVQAQYDVAGLPAGLMPTGTFVQYLNDRPATAMVFMVASDGSQTAAYIVAPCVPGQQPDGATWAHRWDFPIDAADVGGLGAIGVDDNRAQMARAYSLHEDGSLWRTTASVPSTNPIYLRSQVDTGWLSIAGVWTGHEGAGCVGVGDNFHSVRTTQPNTFQGNNTWFVNTTVVLDQPAQGIQAWSDANSLLHVYCQGMGAGSISVLHQLGWVWDAAKEATLPVWDTHLGPTGSQVGTTRGLFAGAVWSAVDAYPDEAPSQLVLHSGVAADDRVALYTQQPGTSYWEREVVRFVPQLPTNAVSPIVVSRYQTKVTVLNAYGAPVPPCAVALTSDAPVDLEVGGAFYRTSPTVPITLTTDLTGSLVLRVLADGLSAPNMHLSVSGVAQALTVQPAAEIHKFLSGAGTLPNQPEGLNATVLEQAKASDGSPLFPSLGPRDTAATWPPTADTVCTWFAAAFAVSARTPLPTAMTTGLAEGQEVLAFSLQTHDESRPACAVITDADELSAHRRRIADQSPFDATEWFGDAVEGIRAGVVTAAQVTVDVTNGILDLLVNLADGTTVWVSGFWDDVVSAAHAVEAMCAALGATVGQVVNWLAWAFDFADVWRTKQTLEAMFKELPEMVGQATAWMRQNSQGWALGARQAISEGFEGLREAFTGLPTASLETPGLPPGTGQSPAQMSSIRDYLGSAHTSWFQGQFDLGITNLPAPAPGGVDPFAQAMAAIAQLPGWDLLDPALQELLQGFGDLLDPNNPQSASTILITTMLDIFEELCNAGVKVADGALDILLNMTDAVANQMLDYYLTPVESTYLQCIYEFVQEQAGVAPVEYEPLTAGRAAMLMGAFPTTVVYKALFGEAPFADGTVTLAEMRALASEGRTAGDVGGVIQPPTWGALKCWQGFCSIMMAFDAYFDAQLNVSTIVKGAGGEANFSPWYFRIWSLGHFIAYGVGDYPPTWGNDFPPQGDSPYDWGPTATWVMSFISNVADVGCSWHWNTFVAFFENDEPPLGIGANIYTGLGVIRLVLSGVRYDYDPLKEWPYNKWNCAINVTSFYSAATGIVRLGYNRTKSDFWLYSLNLKNALDILCDMFAGIASVIQVVYEDNWPPRINPDLAPGPATVGTLYALLLEAVDGMHPYSWTATPVSTPSPGAIAGLPPGIDVVDGDRGYLTGTPTAEGTYEFWVTVSDGYGPSFQYQTDSPVQIVVSNPPPESDEG